MAAPFERLPEELKDLIFESCDEPTLQSSRLTCRSFVPTVNRYLFKEITVDIIDSTRTSRLINIAADPKLCRCVKHLAVTVGATYAIFVQGITIWYQLCLYLEPRLPESDSWILDAMEFRPWPHSRNPIKPTIQAVFRAIERLTNISSVSSNMLDSSGPEVYDPSMNIFMLALSRRLHGMSSFRSGLSVEWGKISQRHLVNIWERQHMRRTHRRNIQDHPIPIFGMIKHLDLYQIQLITLPRCRGFADEEEAVSEGEAEDVVGVKSSHNGNVADIDDDYDPNLYCDVLRLSSLCSQEANTIESLRLNFDRDSLEPTGFEDDLKSWKGFSLSPHLSKVALETFVTTSDTLLDFLRHVSPTLRDLRLREAYILPCNTKSRKEVAIVKNWIMEHQCQWILDHDPSPPDQFWERVVFGLCEIFSSSPLSSFHMGYLIDTVGTDYDGINVEWAYGRILLADDDNYDDEAYDDDEEDYPGSFRSGSEFYRHQFEAVHDYVLGHNELLPPLAWRVFKKKHAQEGCASCAKARTPLPTPTESDDAEE